jgi:hypothetical protein
MVFRRVFTWLARVLVALLLLVAAVGVWLAMGQIEGVEVCPHSFQLRYFSYWRPPLSPLGFGKTVSVSDEFAIALSLTGTFAPAPTRQNRWDLVRDNYSGDGPQSDLGARYLADHFRRSASGPEFHWVQWSRDHQACATRFWPWISRLAVDELYIVLPELFHYAELADTSDDVAFERQLSQLVLDEVRAIRDDALAVGQTSRAQQLDSLLTHYESLAVK